MSPVNPQECMKSPYPAIKVLECISSVHMLYLDSTHSHTRDHQMKKPAGSLKEKKNKKKSLLNILPQLFNTSIGNTMKSHYLQKKSLKITRNSSLPGFNMKALAMKLGCLKRYRAQMTIKLRCERKSHHNLKQPQKE